MTTHKTQKILKECENCKFEIYNIGRGIEGHAWWCKNRNEKDLLQDIAKKLDDISYHLGVK